MSFEGLRIGQWRARAHQTPYQPDAIGLYVWKRVAEREVSYLRVNHANVATMHYDDPGEAHEPSFVLTYERCQELMDSLWASGIRPTEGRGSAGAMAAVEKHLADMRALVAHHAKAKLP